MATVVPKTTVFSIYRSYRRQIGYLPSEYLRQFFRIKLADDVRSVFDASNGKLQRTKLKRVQADLRKLEAARGGDSQAWAHIMDVAYGRKGKLKWEIMTPLLSDPTAPQPDRIIPAVEKSRPPVYSPELTALLTSAVSRPVNALALKNLANPPALPERADPKSEEARLLGPLSKRREVNIRWRYFTDGWKKVLPPLQVEVGQSSSQFSKAGASKSAVTTAGVRPIGFQGEGVYEDIVAAAGPVVARQTVPRRERAESGATNSDAEPDSKPLPRFLRRRYRELLARVPVLTYQPNNDPSKTSRDRRGKYVVSRAEGALDFTTSYRGDRVPAAHDSYLAWVNQSRGPANRANGK